MGVLTWLGDVLTAIGEVMSMQVPHVLAGDLRHGLPVIIGVGVAAGLSTTLGHAVVFAINRVAGLRLLALLLLGAIYMTLLRLATGSAVALVAWLVTGGGIGFWAVAAIYLVAIAPHALGILEFIPHLGLAIGRLLEGWSVLALVALLAQQLQVSGWRALAIGVGVWFAARLLLRVTNRPLARMTSRVWTIATGNDTFVTEHDVMAGVPFIPLERAEAAR